MTEPVVCAVAGRTGLEALFHLDAGFDVAETLVELPRTSVVTENVERDRGDTPGARPIVERLEGGSAETLAAARLVHLDVEYECLPGPAQRVHPQNAHVVAGLGADAPQKLTGRTQAVRKQVLEIGRGKLE